MKALMIFFLAIAVASRFFTSGVFYHMAGVETVGPASFRGVIPSHGESMGRVYLDGEHKSRDAEYVHDECTNAAASDRRGPDVGYVACFVGEMVARPQRLCDQEVKARFIRYSKAYFYIWGEKAVMMRDPSVQQVIRMQRRMEGESDVDSGFEVEDVDGEILDGFEALVKKGVLSAWDFGGFFAPAAPQTVKARLENIKPEGKICK